MVPDSGKRQAYALKLNASRNTTMVTERNELKRWQPNRMALVYLSSTSPVNGISDTQALGGRRS